MKEQIDLIREWRALGPDTEAVLATVVATRGSVYRKPGARMLLTPEQWLAGSISGGCVESDLLRTAWTRTSDGPALATYDASGPDDAILGFGLGCNGAADVLIERLPADGGPLAIIEEVIQSRRSADLFTAISEGPFLGQRWRSSQDVPQGVSVLHEHLEPSSSLVIFGAGHDAISLAKIAKDLGWHVTVADARSAYATKERFPEVDRLVVSPPAEMPNKVTVEPTASVVLMTHSYLQDLEILKWLSASHPGYLGVLGPKHRTERLVAEAGCQIEDLHAPVGLDIGAEGPHEIALSIVAEILAVRKGKSGGQLQSVLSSASGVCR